MAKPLWIESKLYNRRRLCNGQGRRVEVEIFIVMDRRDKKWSVAIGYSGAIRWFFVKNK